ncbi:hypothetical protein Hanom_Chr16g01460011 [Helianthus anomalus]
MLCYKGPKASSVECLMDSSKSSMRKRKQCPAAVKSVRRSGRLLNIKLGKGLKNTIEQAIDLVDSADKKIEQKSTDNHQVIYIHVYYIS